MVKCIFHRSSMINDDREISCDIGSMADQIDHEPTQFMPGILYYRSNAEDSFDFISFPVLTRPDTRLPQTRAGGHQIQTQKNAWPPRQISQSSQLISYR